jgi:hypothetical protein
MAGFQLPQKRSDTFFEDAIVRGCQLRRLLIDFSTPLRVIDIADIEMVLKHDGLHPRNDR